VFKVPELIEYISSVMTLEPGDIIATGTPAGIGPLRHGDRIEAWIEGIGVLRGEVLAEESILC
ncbi:fumarylacetoacetate hydrolase family protein, partial [Thermococcus sp.]